MKFVYLTLLLLWLIPVTVAQLASGFISASPIPPVNAQPRIRFMLQTNDASVTVEVDANGTLSGLVTLGKIAGRSNPNRAWP
ncbi:hypothetical protein [Spirosoma rhododendri]|uniref:Uncharacterized protein n=1 Tax=Spirosoma rhododendri TaxID=2728024 RepID=A0A7L5DMD6_9BACT|nr:hypothetical protein [Spirosoma rhododendri]QJD78651.1 hypothetical protein HH216_09595 [Spirosoma rhododendri]